MKTDTWLTIICSMMVNAVLFGTGAIAVLSVPLLSAHATILLPAVIVASFVAAPFIAAKIAPRMRIRAWGRDAWCEGDVLSG
ncbi:hypothetical protein [Rhizobium sp. SSA_523]|uniref:hypothetical protein n=1 Tax=Rhizobium sp. SSA_523 TaxID=2952477 RepID=UPI0020917F4B|nr:hypothetical protein [Rhizobium sp. SSA_523]MCO5730686.1 hypothetical protein [Rhizobium sp. SSA_523]WKC24486.1 hypothetical protein QTJ18_10535 [Rhizobium sp. SSA_523]